MVKNIFKNKIKFVGAVMLGILLAFSNSSTAFAQANNTQAASAQQQNSDIEKLLLEKQSEIDKFVFEQHAKDIEQKGFKVTHTGQADGYVEIGITPFKQEYADYLYSIFGKENVKIVEGQQAVLVNNSISTTSMEQTKDINSPFASPLIYVVLTAVAIGCIAIVFQKGKTRV